MHNIMEAELQKPEFRLLDSLQTVNVGTWVRDLRSPNVHLSKEACSIFGFKPGQFDDTCDAVMNYIYQDDRQFFVKAMSRALCGNSHWKTKHRIVRPDGSVRVIQSHGETIFDETGQPYLMIGIFVDINAHEKQKRQLLEYQTELRSLASQLSLVEERERRRIALQVHNCIGDGLALGRMKLRSLVKSVPSSEFASRLLEIDAVLKRAIDEARSLSFELSSPLLYELGLEPAIEHLTEEFQQLHNIAVKFEDDGKSKPLDEDSRIILFQTVRELLTNIAKHAQPCQAKVHLEKTGNNLRLVVEDNGTGCDPSIIYGARDNKGFGLFGIRERLCDIRGRVDIESRPNYGTRVIITVPLKQK